MASIIRGARLLPRISHRTFTSTSRTASAPPFRVSPAPPRLPKEEQEIFEKLQRQSTGAFSTPVDVRDEASSATSSSSPAANTSSPLRPQINQSPHSTSDSSSTSETEIRFENGSAIKKGEDLHPNMRRGAPPEFEGDVNPKTGEVGGPKNEPLRWGGQGDWSYNGRVTDF